MADQRRLAALIVIGGMLVAAGLLVAVDPFGEPIPEGYASEGDHDPDGRVDEALNRTAIEVAYHRQINDYRVERGLEPLELDPTLTAIARQKSEDRIVNDYFHDFSRSTYNTTAALSERAPECLPDPDDPPRARTVYGYTFALQAVNTSYGPDDYGADEVAIGRGKARAIYHDPVTRRDVLQSRLDAHGVGVVVEADHTGGTRVMFTQVFCFR